MLIIGVLLVSLPGRQALASGLGAAEAHWNAHGSRPVPLLGSRAHAVDLVHHGEEIT